MGYPIPMRIEFALIIVESTVDQRWFGGFSTVVQRVFNPLIGFKIDIEKTVSSVGFNGGSTVVHSNSSCQGRWQPTQARGDAAVALPI